MTLTQTPCTGSALLRHSGDVRAARIALMEATTAAVWAAYGKVIAQGGFSYADFRRENLGYLQPSLAIAEGEISGSAS